MKYSLDKLQQYIDAGLLIAKNHSDYPLTIYNYSRSCQYKNYWDNITLACRGLVLDDNGNVIALPFAKFFNLEELGEEKIPQIGFDVFEKLDGSLGICYYYQDRWHIATRGSFNSDQAVRASQMLKEYDLSILNPDNTYLFEIIYAENRIVCKYDYEDLIMLAAINRNTGKEENIYEVGYDHSGFKLVKHYDGVTDFNYLKESISENREGYVIRFHNGFRLKIKGTEYVRLHRLIGNITSKSIWAALQNNISIESILESIPDEYDSWIKEVIHTLNQQYLEIENKAINLKSLYESECISNNIILNRKDYAFWVLRQDSELRYILFCLWDNKDYSHHIWKLIEPPFEKALS